MPHDLIQQAELVGAYYQGLTQLASLGLVKDIHVGKNPESFYANPLQTAEYTAGIILAVEAASIPITNVGQIKDEFLEHDESTENFLEGSNLKSGILDQTVLSQKFKSWRLMRAVPVQCDIFLARDIEPPQEQK